MQLVIIHLFLGLSFLLCQASGEKILLLSSMINSHILMMTSLVEPLQARGHVVYLAMDANMKAPADVSKSRVRIIKYETDHPPLFEDEAYQRTLFTLALKWTFGNWIEAVKSGLNAYNDNCQTVLQNEKFFADVKKENFDFVVVGGPGPLRCLFIIPHRLGVPFASLSSAHPFDLRAIGIQAPLLVPGFEARHQATLTMAAKLKKLAAYVASHTILELNSQTYSPDKPYSSLHEVANRASLFLYDTSRVFDTPIPLSPNVIHVGGLTTRKPEALVPGTIKTFLDEADDGFILVSFGGVVKYFPVHVVRLLIDAFSTIKLRVLFKISKSVIPDDVTMPDNVLTQNWIPQKDVLGHKNIKLFITHCGSGGQHEALYSAVPMLGIPIFADQTANSHRMQSLGFGRHLGLDVTSKGTLLELIHEVVQNQTYKQNIDKASELFRDQPMTPSETGAYWIDHVIKYGDDHLKSATNDLSWVQILMIDVLAVVVTIIFLSLLLFGCTIRCCCRLLYRSNRQEWKLKTK